MLVSGKVNFSIFEFCSSVVKISIHFFLSLQRSFRRNFHVDQGPSAGCPEGIWNDRNQSYHPNTLGVELNPHSLEIIFEMTLGWSGISTPLKSFFQHRLTIPVDHPSISLGSTPHLPPYAVFQSPPGLLLF